MCSGGERSTPFINAHSSDWLSQESGMWMKRNAPVRARGGEGGESEGKTFTKVVAYKDGSCCQAFIPTKPSRVKHC